MPTTDQLRNRLLSKLKELFQLDQPDLDFGFFRVMHAKAEQVEKFIGEDLLQIVADAFESSSASKGENAVEAARAKLVEAMGDDALGDDGAVKPEFAATPAGKAYTAAVEKARGQVSSLSDEGQIYDHLYRFFERYYDNGDFISRRYDVRESADRAAPFSIPYHGEEVKLHWANADQYYIKTAEYFNNYRFDLTQAAEFRAMNALERAASGVPEHPVMVQFQIVDASEGEHGNVKAKEDDKRFFILHAEDPIAFSEEGELIVHFEYRADPEKGSKQEGSLRQHRNTEAVEGILAALEEAKEENLAAATCLQLFRSPAPTEKDKKRPLLAKYLNQYTGRNTMDYFIHKDLGSFLRRELDFYIKNEVVRLDDLDQADVPAVETYLGKLKVLRKIARKLIDFLAQLEEFQKKLWLKKKFVVETNYCLTLDRVPEELYEEIAANDAQREEWVKLFAIDEIEATEGDLVASGTPGYCRPLSIGFLKANDKLVLDTKFFDGDFKARLLEAIEDFDAQCDGLLVYSENYQALRTLSERYQSASKVIYIDPPYNTDVSAIPYKNDYRHASWATLMADRTSMLRKLMSEDGAIFVSIDKHERLSLEFSLAHVFGRQNQVEELIWIQNTNDGRSPTYSTNHEYVLVYSKNKPKVEQDYEMFREPKPGYSEVMQTIARFDGKYPPIEEVETALNALYSEHRQRLREEIEAQDLDWESEKRNDPWKGLYNYKHCEYRLPNGKFISEEDARNERAGAIWVYRESDWTIMSSESKQSETTRDPANPNYRYYDVFHPVTGKKCNPSSRGWKGTRYVDPEYPDRNSFESLLSDHRIAFGPDENKVPQQKRFIHEVESNVCKSVFADYSDGEKETYAMFGKSGIFLAPKHTNFVRRFIQQGGNKSSLVIDCFGGSGSTAHAVIKQNREDHGNRRYLLAEMGLHFENVLRPRIQKAIYSMDWRKGKPASRDTGISHCFKYLRLESYEDTLNNLIFDSDPKREEVVSASPALKEDYMLRYLLDVETRGSQSLLNIDAFSDPTAYRLSVKKPGSDEQETRHVDLIETFNYLIGLRVVHLAAPRTFAATFQRETDPELPQDQQTKLVLNGGIKQDASGPWWFRKVEGWVPKDPSILDHDTRSKSPENMERVLVVWRKLTGDLEQDNAVLDEWFRKHGISTRDYEFDTIYVNGSNNLPNLRTEEENWKVRLIEEDFLKRMWDTSES